MCNEKNASTVWGEIFFYLVFKKVSYLLNRTSFGFESRATHINDNIELIYYIEIIYQV